MEMHRILWRRLDAPGHDFCRISSRGDGWAIQGTAVFRTGDDPSSLDYHVECEKDWTTVSGRVSGWAGGRTIDFSVARGPDGRWDINGTRFPEFDGLFDIDLGFTPATNTNAIRRMKLENGASSKTVAVWLNTHDWTFECLEQSYERLSDRHFEYHSPAHDYHAKLTVNASGVVVDYPDLWVEEA